MKRDMDLIRQILLELEAMPWPKTPRTLKVSEYDQEEVNYHLLLMAEAGLLKLKGEEKPGGVTAQPWRLTWKGHEFLETSRNDTAWRRAKQALSDKVGGVPFNVLQALLIELAKGAVLPPTA